MFISLLFIPFIGGQPQSNKIIIMVSPPRSLSVAFLRMMETRGDFVVMNEPSQYAYISIEFPELTDDWFHNDAFKTFEQVKQKIFELAKTSHVFVKEMSFAIEEFILQDQELINDKRVQFIFLLRNPHHQIISFYKKIPRWQAGFSDIVGYKATYHIFEKIKSQAINKPLIILSENLYQKPYATVKNFCAAVDIEFKEHALQWEKLDQNFTGEQWHEIKQSELTHHWHDQAIASNGFIQPHIYETDQEGNPTFTEIGDEEHKNMCKNAYQENLFYYNLMFEDADYICKSFKG